MGLINSYGDGNKVILTSNNITYSVRRIKGNWVKTSMVADVVLETYTSMYEYHRYANYSYTYVGMSYSAAQACVADCQRDFIRATKESEWDEILGDWTDVNGGSYLMCDITAVKRAGDMYDVQVNFREDDSRIRKDADINPTTLFSTENQRSYDL